jgi:hypothetical protein
MVLDLPRQPPRTVPVRRQHAALHEPGTAPVSGRVGRAVGQRHARAEAGYVDVSVRDVLDDPLNQVYVSRTATA